MTDPTPITPNTSVFLDTSLPNTARIFDYLAGGNANFQADRQAAEAMLKLLPSLKKWVRLRRAFVQEAAYRLHEDGFRQFLDLGSGMPADDHIHAFAPDARVVYSDINPVAVSYGNSLFNELDHVDYIRGNATEIKELLENKSVKKLIHPDKKLAIGLNGLVLFLSAEENKEVAQHLYDWSGDGSNLFLVFQTHGTITNAVAYEAFLEIARSAFLPIQLYTLDENIEMMHPWKPKLLEPVTSFLGLPDDFIKDEDREGIDMAFYAVILEK